MKRQKNPDRHMVSSTIDIEGVLVVDKPPSMTSHDVVERVRRLLKIRRVGHTGTLDPFATGVLVLCVARATRIARYFEGLEKAYKTVLKLGVVTDTGDGGGRAQEIKPVPDLTTERIEIALEAFRGTITQRPPSYSAIKVGGERLYVRARRGEKVSAPLREVTIRKLEFESLEGDELALFVECSKGTYIRSLAYDIGQQLGCGAHCMRLVRTKVGPFALEEALDLEQLEDLGERGAIEKLLSVDQALSRFLEPVAFGSEGVTCLIHGQPVENDPAAHPPAIIQWGATYRALDSTGKLIALVEAERRSQGVFWVPTRVLAVPI